MNDSLQILRALAEGRHPLTGEALPEESCYQSAKVLRALLAGIEALEKTAGETGGQAAFSCNLALKLKLEKNGSLGF